MNLLRHRASSSRSIASQRDRNNPIFWQRRDFLHYKGDPTFRTSSSSVLEQSAPVKRSEEQDHASSPSPAAADEQDKFDWAKGWYPLAIEANLPTNRPTAHRLLGNPVVIWKDGQGQWRAFKDLCPHRLVALSEGRIENGNLMCSYHGWQFAGSGKLTDVPQADSEKTLETAINSQRSCAQVYPCQVHDGLIWVYGSCAPGAEEEAAKNVPPELRNPEVKDPDYDGFRIPWFSRNLPYSAETLLENVLDPSHVPFAHHGIQGNRFKVKKMHMNPAKEIAPSGFSVVSSEPEDLPEGERSPMFPYTLQFTAPSLIRYNWNNGNRLISYAVPTDPGRSLIIFSVLFPNMKLKGLKGALIKVLQSERFQWVDHLTRNNVLDGDGVFLCMQDQDMRKAKEEGRADKLFYMPSTLDFGVTALHKWLTNSAKPIPYGPGALDADVLRTAPRKVLLDRFEQHTQHCNSCKNAYQFFSNLRWVAAGLAVAAAIGAAYSLGGGASLKGLVLPALVVLISGALAKLSSTVKGRMEFQDYVHPDH